MRKIKLQPDASGFTVIEFLVFLLIVLTAAFLVLVNIRSSRAEGRDRIRKTDLNAIAFQLEAFYEKSNYYPSTISQQTLPDISEDSLTDPFNVKIGEETSEYKYDPRGCSKEKCTGYVMTSDLENENNYRRESLNK